MILGQDLLIEGKSFNKMSKKIFDFPFSAHPPYYCTLFAHIFTNILVQNIY